MKFNKLKSCPEILKSKEFKEVLYHISLNENLEGEWIPQVPYDASANEPSFPRICCSTSLEGCFYAIYKSINAPFYNGVEYLDFYVYEPQINPLTTFVVSNKVIIDNKMVFDAHMTLEHFICSPVYMKKIGILRVFNPLNNEEIHYHLFNDRNNKKCFLSYKADFYYLPIKEQN